MRPIDHPPGHEIERMNDDDVTPITQWHPCSIVVFFLCVVPALILIIANWILS